MSKIDKTSLITDTIRVTYLFAFRPYKSKEAKEDQKPKYKVTCLFRKDKYDMSAIKRAIRLAREAKFGDKPPKKLKMPIQDGDENDDENFHGHWTITASSETKPEILDEDGIATDSEVDVYSGCYGKVYLKAFGYDRESKGVSFAFNGFQKIKDGERLSGRVPMREALGLDDSDDDDDQPRKSKRKRDRDDDDDDEDMMPKKKKKFNYDDDDDRPRKKRKREEVDPDDF